MKPIQLEYTKFLVQNQCEDFSGDFVNIDLNSFVKNGVYSQFDKSCYLSVNIMNFYNKIITSRKSRWNGMFLTKLNDQNFIKLNDFFIDYLNMAQFEMYKNLFKSINALRSYLSAVILYDIKIVNDSERYYGVCVENFSGNYEFKFVPLSRIMFCFNTQKYWLH